jgi:hypothetical protein
LRIGLQARVTSLRRTFRVEAAIAAAGHNVQAVGLGRKLVAGRPTDQMAVRLYVVQKIAPSLIPPRDRLPESFSGVPTDVIESSPAFLAAAKRVGSHQPGMARRPRRAAPPAAARAEVSCTANRQKSQRPLVAGISIAHRDVTAGTLGYFCRSLRLGDDPAKVHVLSNNHVLANVNQGGPDDEIYQPGPADGGAASDRAAELRRFVPIELDGSPNKVDAAIAELLPGVRWQPELCAIGRITGVQDGVEGMEVRKHGRTTGYTEGTITDESYDALVGVDRDDPNGIGLFQAQLRIERASAFPAFGLAGDSGSLVVSKAVPQAVGLYFAGPPGGSYGIASPIADVLGEMQIELLTDADTDVA